MTTPSEGSGTVTIAGRFHGPPGSGNGGYTCGLAAGALGPGPARVRLRVPPPLDRPLAVERRDGAAVLLDGDVVVAEVRPTRVDLELPAPVDLATATAALDRFDVDGYRAAHAFPTCFTCGPSRAPGEGLRIFPAPIEGRDGLVASPWSPDRSLAGHDGLVRPEMLWAALDCPGGLAWITGTPPTGPAVLGQLAVSVDRRPAPGDRLVVAGWRIGADGRKCHAGTALWAEDGELLAVGAAVWVVLDDEQRSGFTGGG